MKTLKSLHELYEEAIKAPVKYAPVTRDFLEALESYAEILDMASGTGQPLFDGWIPGPEKAALELAMEITECVDKTDLTKDEELDWLQAHVALASRIDERWLPLYVELSERIEKAANFQLP